VAQRVQTRARGAETFAGRTIGHLRDLEMIKPARHDPAYEEHLTMALTPVALIFAARIATYVILRHEASKPPGQQPGT